MREGRKRRRKRIRFWIIYHPSVHRLYCLYLFSGFKIKWSGNNQKCKECWLRFDLNLLSNLNTRIKRKESDPSEEKKITSFLFLKMFLISFVIVFHWFGFESGLGYCIHGWYIVDTRLWTYRFPRRWFPNTLQFRSWQNLHITWKFPLISGPWLQVSSS